jgi:hypothetical protein
LTAVLNVPDELAPTKGEAAVLSMLAVREGSAWVLAAGSLLTVPANLAGMSWKRWGELQPHAPALLDHQAGFDLGPIFCAEPFPGVRAVRAIIDPADWRQLVDGIGDGKIDVTFCPCRVAIAGSSSTVLLGQEGKGEAYEVVGGARRPVLCVVVSLDPATMPATKATWEWAAPTYLEPGPDLGAIAPHRQQLHWPKPLLGIGWLGSDDFAPPPRFAIGRLQSSAWIARVRPNFDTEHIVISIGWDENLIDPLGCSLVLRTERDGLPLLVRHQRVSDLPGHGELTIEPRTRSWDERTLDVSLPRPRRTD